MSDITSRITEVRISVDGLGQYFIEIRRWGNMDWEEYGSRNPSLSFIKDRLKKLVEEQRKELAYNQTEVVPDTEVKI